MKKCSKCKVEKPFEAFDFSKKYKSGRRSECKTCRNTAYAANIVAERQKRKAWRQANGDVASKNHARWAAENAERLREYQAAYRNDPENKARKAARSAAQPAQNSARVTHRRAMKIRATPPWACELAILEKYKTARVAAKLTGQKWHVDHIVPLQSPLVCGLHCEANLQLLLAVNNIAKRNRFWPDMPL